MSLQHRHAQWGTTIKLTLLFNTFFAINFNIFSLVVIYSEKHEKEMEAQYVSGYIFKESVLRTNMVLQGNDYRLMKK
jgi:hypothetical protein